MLVLPTDKPFGSVLLYVILVLVYLANMFLNKKSEDETPILNIFILSVFLKDFASSFWLGLVGALVFVGSALSMMGWLRKQGYSRIMSVVYAFLVGFVFLWCGTIVSEMFAMI